MGFSTNITISNDFWHEIAKDPQKLVDGISVGMNDGTHSPLGEALAEEDGAADYLKDLRFRLRYQVAPQGVIVHKAQHNDVPQIIVNTYGSQAVAAHEIPAALEYGWLDLNDYNEKQAEAVAKELHATAARIRSGIRDAKKRKAETGTSARPRKGFLRG